MSSTNTQEGTPRAVSTLDLESVNLLRERLIEMSQNDVKVVQGESVADKVEVSERLTEQLGRRLGASAAEGNLVIGLATVDGLEDDVLSEARRLQPSERKLY